MTFRKSDNAMTELFRQHGVKLNTAYWKEKDRTIHYAWAGDPNKPKLVFIHGTPGSWNAFADYMMDSVLLSKYQVISIDRPGFGYSDFGKAEPLDVQSAMMGPLLTFLKNGKPMVLVGHSLGGPMAFRLDADHPELADALVIISGSQDPAEEKPERWRPVIFNTPLNLLVPGAFRPSNEELWFLKKDLVDLKRLLPTVTASVYFIHGSKDTWVPPGNVVYTRALLTSSKNIQTTTIEGGNHFIPWTSHKQIVGVIQSIPLAP